jgi:hypothetical protein
MMSSLSTGGKEIGEAIVRTTRNYEAVEQCPQARGPE